MTRDGSFVAEMLRGRPRMELLTELVEPDGEQARRGEAFLTRLTAFLTDKVDPARIEREDRIPDEVLHGLGELGALGMCVPPEAGGAGLNKLQYTRALQLVGSWSPVLGTMLSAHQSTGLGQQLMLHGTPEQRRRYLPLVARREVSAFMVAEPEGGSDPRQVVTTATPTRDGSGYLLNGVKLWATNGVIADRFVVLAQVPPGDARRGGVSLFIVAGGAPGVRVENRNSFMGLRGIENGMIRFTDVHIPAEDRIGPEGAGLKLALATINHGRLSLPSICAATSKWALRIAREWCAERRQWGRPIGEHEANALKLAHLAGIAYAQNAVVETCAMLADTPGRDIRIEAALTKLWCAEQAWNAADELVQLRGGRGYESAASLVARGEPGVPAEQVLRDLRPFRIFEGTSEMMRVIISREAVNLTGLTGSTEPHATEPHATEPHATEPHTAEPHGISARAVELPEFGELTRHVDFVGRGGRWLAEVLAAAAARWGDRLLERQGHLARIVDITAELFAMACVCARASREAGPATDTATTTTATDTATDTATATGAQASVLADTFCRGARRRIERLRADLDLSDTADVADVAVARRVLRAELTLAEQGVLDPSAPAPGSRATSHMRGPDARRVLACGPASSAGAR
jgi:hypothetical protein